MSRPRVLLVDDDPSIRRFVVLALAEMEIDLVSVGGVAQALAVLRADGPVQLLLTDLMMPGASGVDLLRHLATAPALRGDARLVLFSAGWDSMSQKQLTGLGLWRQLQKPISVLELEACVRDAVQPRAVSDAHADAAVPAAAASQSRTVLCAAERAAVDRHFGSELALFTAFRSTCLRQFVDDLREGGAAFDRRDAQALRRLAHSLKSVLATLGHEALGRLAEQLEAVAAAADWPAAGPLWHALREGVSRLCEAAPAAPRS